MNDKDTITIQKQKCDQCGNIEICSHIHIIGAGDSLNNFRSYCDMCLTALFHTVHRQMVAGDYIKSKEAVMYTMHNSKIEKKNMN